MTNTVLFALPTPSALFRTCGAPEVINRINQEIGSSSGLFGSASDPFSTGYNVFMQQVVMPFREATRTVLDVASKIIMQDTIKPIVTQHDLLSIPPCMQLIIAMHEPVKKLMQQGRIDGFGFNPQWLPDENPYHRLCVTNGYSECTKEDIGNVEKNMIVNEHWSTDPRLSPEEMTYIEETYGFIDYFLASTDYDPTDFPSKRG